MEDFEIADEETPKALLGESVRGINAVSLRQVGGGGAPQKFECFLLQSRHSSALFPGLLI